MRKLVVIFAFVLFGLNSNSQTECPFPMKNAMWTEMYNGKIQSKYCGFNCFALKNNDTIINEKRYSKLYHNVDTVFTEDNLCGGIREENRRVYYYSINPEPFSVTDIPKNTEKLLYDFNLKLGDTIKNDVYNLGIPDRLVVYSVDSILINSIKRKAYTFSYLGGRDGMPWAVWIEGIGSIRGLLFPTSDMPTGNFSWDNLMCFIQDNNLIYHSSLYPNCFYDLRKSAIPKTEIKLDIRIKNNSKFNIISVEFNDKKYNSLQISTLTGTHLNQYNISGLNTFQLNRRSLPKGIYFLTFVSNNGESISKKIILD